MIPEGIYAICEFVESRVRQGNQITKINTFVANTDIQIFVYSFVAHWK